MRHLQHHLVWGVAIVRPEEIPPTIVEVAIVMPGEVLPIIVSRAVVVKLEGEVPKYHRMLMSRKAAVVPNKAIIWGEQVQVQLVRVQLLLELGMRHMFPRWQALAPLDRLVVDLIVPPHPH